MTDRLYVVVDARLPSGLKMAQAIHGFRAFQTEHPYIETRWYYESNNIVVLEHEDVSGLADELEACGLKVSRFHEPDCNDALTAICVEPRAWRHLSSIRLAG